MYTDLHKPTSDDFFGKKPKKIIIHHTVDLLEGEMKGSDRFDGKSLSFNKFEKLSYQHYRYKRFFSHYFVEQIGNTFGVIVGTSEDLKSPFLEDYFWDERGSILILISGDYGFDIVPEELYIRLGNICGSIIRRYSLGSNAIQLLEDIPNENFAITKMKFFNKNLLNARIRK